MEYTREEWRAVGKKLFGSEDKKQWKFKCPGCGVSIKGEEWFNQGVPDMFAFSCIGRALKEKGEFLKDKKQPCNYAGGGLFALNPVKVVLGEESIDVMAFDHPDFLD